MAEPATMHGASVLHAAAFDGLHGDPRWETLLADVGLLPYWRELQERDASER